jgi:hypothetical protein
MQHLTKIGSTEYALASTDQITSAEILDEIRIRREELAGLGESEPSCFEGFFLGDDETVAVRGLFAIFDVRDNQVFFEITGKGLRLSADIDEAGDVGSVILRDGLVIYADGGFFTREGVTDLAGEEVVSEAVRVPNSAVAYRNQL